jgi:hypothetical protein
MLGAQWLVVFFAATGGAFFLLGAAGWTGVGRALCAMGLGPVLATGIIGAWWIIRRPTLAPPTNEDTNKPSSRTE